MSGRPEGAQTYFVRRLHRVSHHKALGKIVAVGARQGVGFACVRQVVVTLDHFTGDVRYFTSRRRCATQSRRARGSRAGCRPPSPALVVAMLALFVALGGAAYAVTLGKNDVKTRNIASGAVTGSRLAAGAVKTAKIRDGAVTTTKIADGAVGASALGDGAVERPKIKAQAVTNPKLADGAISAEKLAANSVTSASVLAAVSQTIDPANLGLDECVRVPVAVSSVQAGRLR